MKIELDEYTELESSAPGQWILREYCIGSGRSQEGSCRCQSHNFFEERSVTVAEAHRIAKDTGVSLKNKLVAFAAAA